MLLRRLALALAFGCAVSSTARADSALPVHAGLWGLELGIQNLSGSGSLIGVAGRHHVGERSALRVGLAGRVTGSDFDDTSKDEYFTPDTSVSTPGDRRSSSTDQRDITLFAHWVGYHGLDEHFGMTLEAGPTVHWGSSEYRDEIAYTDYPEQSQVYAHDSNLWEYGVDLQAGFEWFFTRHVSLAARYGIAALRTDARDTTEEWLFASQYDYTRHDYREAHSDGFAIRTTFPVVSLNATW